MFKKTKMVFNQITVRNIGITNRNQLTWSLVYFIMIIQLCYILILKYNGTFMTYYEYSVKDTKCYSQPETFLISTEDPKFRTPDKSIFFLETSCTGGLNSRQACAVETAAKANPDWEIKVLFTGPLTSTYRKGIAFQTLTSMPNIQFARINLTEFTERTPVEKRQLDHVLKLSHYPMIHSSDILRILTLYKWGGIYLDLDVIVMKSFNNLPSNFVVRQGGGEVASGILAFGNDEIGRKFVDVATRQLQSLFQPWSWSGNGPDMILRTLEDLCDTPILTKMSDSTCNGFEVFDMKYFFPLDYTEVNYYFIDSDVNDSDAYMHHVWNALSRHKRIRQDSLYSKLAKQYCPIIFNLYGEEFGS